MPPRAPDAGSLPGSPLRAGPLPADAGPERWRPAHPLDGFGLMAVAGTIIQSLPFSRIVQIGTVPGQTATWLARFGLPVDAIEPTAIAGLLARLRLLAFAQARVHVGPPERLCTSALAPWGAPGLPVFAFLSGACAPPEGWGRTVRGLTRSPARMVLMLGAPPRGADGRPTREGRPHDLGQLRAQLPQSGQMFRPYLGGPDSPEPERGTLVISCDPGLGAVLSALPCLRRIG